MQVLGHCVRNLCSVCVRLVYGRVHLYVQVSVVTGFKFRLEPAQVLRDSPVGSSVAGTAARTTHIRYQLTLLTIRFGLHVGT